MTADGVTGDREADGGRGFRGKLWFWLPWPLLVALDLWSKWWVFALLEREYPHVAAEPQRVHPVSRTELLRFDLVQWRNPGTIWGLFQDGTLALMVLRCCAIVGLFWFVYRTPRQKRLQLAVLSLILAGAIGNLYDNFFCPARSVRDFLYFTGSWPVDWSFPAFNIADASIVIGVILLGWSMLRMSDESSAEPVVDADSGEQRA